MDSGLRAHGYRLLAEIFLEGISEDTLPFLEESLSDGSFPEGTFDPIDRDDAAAEHFRVFTHVILPYASVFLEPVGTLGGEQTTRMERAHLELGLDPMRRSEPADHLGRVLKLLEVTTREGRADLCRRIVDASLLRWLPPLCAALSRRNERLWSGSALLALEAVLDHRGEWSDAVEDGSEPAELEPVQFEPREFEPRAFARRMSLPHACGIYLSGPEIRSIGRAGELPGGFGTRAVVLENLLGSAVTYDAVPLVAQEIRARIVADRALFTEMRDDLGLPDRYVEPWTGRMDRTERYLAALERFVAEAGP